MLNRIRMFPQNLALGMKTHNRSSVTDIFPDEEPWVKSTVLIVKRKFW